jgi:hypothetical protein
MIFEGECFSHKHDETTGRHGQDVVDYVELPSQQILGRHSGMCTN